MALAWLALRVRWRRAWTRSIAVALAIGAVGGFILAAAASARGVGDTYQTLITDINAPDLVVVPDCEPAAVAGCVAPLERPNGDVIVEAIESLAPVEQARVIESISPYFVDSDGQPLLATVNDPYGCYDDDRSVSLVALAPGGSAEQAMPFRLDGELPAAGGSGVVLTLATADRVGLKVGDSIRLAGYCTGEGDTTDLPRMIHLQVTGLSVGPLDIEPPNHGLAIEPAFVDGLVIERLISLGAEPELNVAVWLDPSVSPDAVGAALTGNEIAIDLRARAAVFDDALAADARLLWLLAGIGMLGAALLLAPLLSRNVRDTAGDTPILVALGSSRRQITIQALTHVVVLAVIGAVSAALLAPPISALLPRGFATAISPTGRLWFDPLVTIVGVPLLVCAVIAIGAVPAWRSASPHHASTPTTATRRGWMTGLSRMRPATRSGVLSAVGSPVGPRHASPWPSLVSLAIAGATCVASLGYLAGLSHFERTPSLMGWNWDAGAGFDATSAERVPSILDELNHIDGVDVVTAGTIYPPTLLAVSDSGLAVWPWSFATGPQAITPSMLSGRAPDGPDEVAINELFAEANGLVVGDSVMLDRPALVSALAQDFGLEQPDEPPVVASFEVTGLAVLPLERTQEFAQAAFTLDGLAAFVEPGEDEFAAAREWLPANLPVHLQAAADDFLSNTDISDRGVFLRFSGDPQSTVEAIERIDGIDDVIAPSRQQVLTEGLAFNLASNHHLPNALVIVVSTAATALLGYLVLTAVRARRFEFAVMKALGLARGGVRWSGAAQATATALIPLAAAIPLGVAVGRWAWLQQARQLDVVPEAVTPWPALAILSAGAVLIANLAALITEWSTTRRSPADNLRVE